MKSFTFLLIFYGHWSHPAAVLKAVPLRSASEGNKYRGVQYVYCVMHKCIMVKIGGKKNMQIMQNIRKWNEESGNCRK